MLKQGWQTASVSAHPKVCMKLSKADGAYRVQSCMVWLDNTIARFLRSGETYDSQEATIVDMKRQSMNLLRESGKMAPEHEVEWMIESE